MANLATTGAPFLLALSSAALVWFTRHLWIATKRMADESQKAADAYGAQTVALQDVKEELHRFAETHLPSLTERIQVFVAAERQKEIDTMAQQVFDELERNKRLLETPGGDLVYILTDQAWQMFRSHPIFAPDDMRKIEWFYSVACPALQNKTSSDVESVKLAFAVAGETTVRAAALSLMNCLCTRVRSEARMSKEPVLSSIQPLKR